MKTIYCISKNPSQEFIMDVKTHNMNILTLDSVNNLFKITYMDAKDLKELRAKYKLPNYRYHVSRKNLQDRYIKKDKPEPKPIAEQPAKVEKVEKVEPKPITEPEPKPEQPAKVEKPKSSVFKGPPPKSEPIPINQEQQKKKFKRSNHFNPLYILFP